MRAKRILVIASAVLVLALLIAWWYAGGIEPSRAYVTPSGHPAPWAAQLLYRGCRIPGTDLVLFKRYYAIVEKDPGTGLTISVLYQGVGYNPFTAFYADGRIAAEGSCKVTWNDDQMLHNIHDLKEGRFYNPQGQQVSCVDNGTGVQTLFHANGTKYWELRLEGFQRRKLTIWNPDGSMRKEETY